MPNFLILFQAAQETTEQLALALGLGAVQRGANIRLRLLSPEATANMHQGYGRLKAADVEWADVIAVGLEAHQPASELEPLFVILADFPADALAGKLGYVYSVGDHGELDATRARLAAAGLRLAKDMPHGADLTAATMERIGNALAAI
jgi:hypothetical protein